MSSSAAAVPSVLPAPAPTTTFPPKSAADQYVIEKLPNINPVPRFNPNTKFHCNVCKKNIGNVAFIKCAKCVDFDLCLECFNNGEETMDHRADHPYMVEGDPKLSVFEESWGIGEEALLLESIEMYGFGNWEDIANHVATKSEEECMNHYFDVYIIDRPDLTPDIHKPSSTRADALERAKRRKTEDDVWAAMPKPAHGLKSTGSASAIDSAGYMPLRGDFDYEYQNDAERHVKDIAFTGDDNALERDLKFAIIDMYNTVLDNRCLRRRVIEDEGLFDLRKIQAADRKRPPEERELREMTKNFVRFQEGKDHKEFRETLDNQFRMKARILVLQEYRRHGITTLADAQKYEIAKKEREAEKERRVNANDNNKRGNERRSAHLMDRSNAGRHYGNNGVDLHNDEKGALAQLRKYRHLQALDLTGVPGVSLLSHKERKLCSCLRFSPEEFTKIKRTLITESHQNNGIARADVLKKFENMDNGKVGVIFDYLVEAGYVKV